MKLLHDKLSVLSLRHADTPDEWRFPRPSFKARTPQRAGGLGCGGGSAPGRRRGSSPTGTSCALELQASARRPATPIPHSSCRLPQVVILYVDEEESVRRQMRRAQLAAMHNKRVMDAGAGDVWDVRTTDVNEALCRRRYQARVVAGHGGTAAAACAARLAVCPPAVARPGGPGSWPCRRLPCVHPPCHPRLLINLCPTHPPQVFKAHYHTILRLKSFFPFSLIDAMGTLEEARQQIMRELVRRARAGQRGGGWSGGRVRGPRASSGCEPSTAAHAQGDRQVSAGACLVSHPPPCPRPRPRPRPPLQRYQSSLDLDEATYAAIRCAACGMAGGWAGRVPCRLHLAGPAWAVDAARGAGRVAGEPPAPPPAHRCSCACCARRHLPLARDLVRVARQRLVFRLDSYCKRDNRLFQDVIK